jgi:hypothetical protein
MTTSFLATSMNRTNSPKSYFSFEHTFHVYSYVQQQNCNEQLMISLPGHVNGASNSTKLNLRISVAPTKRLISDQFFLMALGYHLPLQQSTSEWLDAKPRWKVHTRRNKGKCKSNSEKCTGRSDADPDCQCTISCSYINKCCDQYGHMVTSCGDVRKKQYRHNTAVSE